MGVPGPWFDRLPHFRMGFTPSSGKELQAEYFVPRGNAVDAILAIERLRDRITPHLFISEIRTIDADELWLSPCYKRPSVAIHFTWKPDWDSVRDLLPVIEKELSPNNVRPHWGNCSRPSRRPSNRVMSEWATSRTSSGSMILVANFGILSWQKTSMSDASQGKWEQKSYRWQRQSIRPTRSWHD